MKDHIIPSIRLTLISLIFIAGVYIPAMLAIAQLAPNKGKGSVVIENNNTYYLNVGQSFKLDKYFWSRPSAVDYNAAGSGGSNKGPSNPAYLAQVNKRIEYFLVHNPGIKRTQIPSDLVTASGSGIDPHISIQAALIQVKRIAVARNLSENTLHQLIQKYTEHPLFGLFGPEKINVLELNLALDNL